MRTPPLLADFIHARACKPFCEKSLTLPCVVLDNIKWSGSRSCKCTIQFVLDDIESETYFQKGNRLYLYYDYRKIAEGVVE